MEPYLLRWVRKTRVWSRLVGPRLASLRLSVGDEARLRGYRLDRVSRWRTETEEECRELAIKLDRLHREQLPNVTEVWL